VNYLAPAKTYADCVASIDSRRLYRLGLFDRSPNVIMVECQVISAESPRLHVEVSWDAEAQQVQISVPGRGDAPPQAVAVTRNTRPRGGGFYFGCPIAGESCEKLYYVEGSWGGRKAKRLKYSSQSGSLHNRYSHSARRMVSLLEGTSGRPLPSPDERTKIEARLAQIERKLAELRRSSSSAAAEPSRYSDLRPLSENTETPVTLGRLLACDKAVERAAALATEDDDALGWLFRRSDLLKAVVSLTPPDVTLSIARALPDFLENYPRISLRTLTDLGLIKPGSRRGVQLDWSGLGCEIEGCNLMVDLRDGDMGFAGLEIFSGGQIFDQAVRVAATSEGELRFVCPLSGVEVDTIAFRAGCFASPAALRMTRRHGRI